MLLVFDTFNEFQCKMSLSFETVLHLKRCLFLMSLTKFGACETFLMKIVFLSLVGSSLSYMPVS